MTLSDNLMSPSPPPISFVCWTTSRDNTVTLLKAMSLYSGLSLSRSLHTRVLMGRSSSFHQKFYNALKDQYSGTSFAVSRQAPPLSRSGQPIERLFVCFSAALPNIATSQAIHLWVCLTVFIAKTKGWLKKSYQSLSITWGSSTTKHTQIQEMVWRSARKTLEG